MISKKTAYQGSSLRGLSTRSETTAGSFRSAGSVKAASLHENLMRCQKRDPFEIYGQFGVCVVVLFLFLSLVHG
jgi:hypothetical protein